MNEAPSLELRVVTSRDATSVATSRQETVDGVRYLGGVDAVMTIQVAARARLTEMVDAESELGHSQRSSDECERMRVAIEHRDDGHTFLVRAHERLEVG